MNLLLKNRSFSYYLIGYFLSQLGNSVFFITAAWMIVEITGSGLIMGTFLMLLGIPRIIFMIIGGVTVDRFDAKKLMMLSDILRALVLLFILLFQINGMLSTSILYIIAVIFGTVDSFYWPATGALRQRLVEKEQYVKSNSILIGSMQISNILGPVMGAALLSIGGYIYSMIFIFFAFLISALTLFFVKLTQIFIQEDPKKEEFSFKEKLIEGFAFILKTPIILTMIIISFFANAGANGAVVGLAFLAQDLGIGASGLGNMSAGWGIGGLFGAILLSALNIKNPTPKKALISFCLQGGALLFVGIIFNQWIIILLLAISGLTSTAIQVFTSSVNQTIIPAELMGRVFSVIALVSMGSTPFAQAMAGWAIDLYSAQTIFVIGGSLEIVVALLAFLVPQIRYYDSKLLKKQVTGTTTA